MGASIRLIDQADRGELDFFVQFGGQGTPWFNELKRAYGKPELNRFFEVAFGALREELKGHTAVPGVDFAYDVKSWLDDPDNAAPHEDLLEITPISMPLIQILQLANLEMLYASGFDRSPLLRNTRGSTGHSQGLITAALFSMGLCGDDYYEHLGQFVKYLLLLGIRSQEQFPEVHSSAEDRQYAESLGVHDPSPMLAVLGADHQVVSDLVVIFNDGRLPEKQIHISLYNSPENRIVSGHRRDLLEFIEQNTGLLEEKTLKFVFVKSSCPFHSPLMARVEEEFARDLERIGFSLPAEKMHLPVVSFADGRDVREDANPGLSVARDITVNPLQWEHALGPLLEAGVDREAIVIDTGPGKTTQRFTTEILKNKEKPADAYAVGVPRDFKKLIES